MGAEQIDWGRGVMTGNQTIVLEVVVAGTCWTWILKMTIDHAAKRIVARLESLEKRLDRN